MSTIKVVSMTGAEVGSVELNDAIFGIEPNMSVVHEVVKNHPATCPVSPPRPQSSSTSTICSTPRPS